MLRFGAGARTCSTLVLARASKHAPRQRARLGTLTRLPAGPPSPAPTPLPPPPFAPLRRSQKFDVPVAVEGLPDMKPEDQQYFGKLLKVCVRFTLLSLLLLSRRPARAPLTPACPITLSRPPARSPSHACLPTPTLSPPRAFRTWTRGPCLLRRPRSARS